MVHQFRAFIDQERWRFDTRDNNLFYFAFREIVTYRSFLDIIRSRSDAIGSEYVDCMNAYGTSVEGLGDGHALSPSQQALLARWEELTLALRLEIETYHLFAAILLDRVAAAIGFYFEGAPSKAWARHSTLIKRFEAYASTRNIAVPERFLEVAQSLKKYVLEFRHEQVVHEESLRAMRGTGFLPGQGPRLVLSSLYPRPDDQQHETLYLAEEAAIIDDYLTKIMELLINNRDQTSLQLVTKVATST